ncbi:MAG: type II secretion system protein [Gemmatimonadota bacterium]
MARSGSRADGFTLLEVLVALAVLSAVIVVGLESVGMGAAARVRAAEHAALREIATEKLAEVTALSGHDLEALRGVSSGRFAPPFEDALWALEVEEDESGTGLFRVTVAVKRAGLTLEASTYLNRFGELWANRRAPAQR